MGEFDEMDDVDIIGMLDREEEQVFSDYQSISENRREGGSKVLDNILKKGSNMSSVWDSRFGIGHRANVIPSSKAGSCTDQLRVFIGGIDDTHFRFFEALAHVTLFCPGTQLIIIHLGSDRTEYQPQEIRAFRTLKGCRTFIKPYGERAFRI